MIEDRMRVLREGRQRRGPVIYWMSRDQRANDNWALLYAQASAIDRRSSLYVCFCVVPSFLDATRGHYAFMLEGLKHVESDLRNKRIPFLVLTGDPIEEVPGFARRIEASLLVGDFDPLREKRLWKNRVAERIDIPFLEVDARNIVPCWIASQKQEYAARTIRPKIRRLLGSFLDEIPQAVVHPVSSGISLSPTDWDAVACTLPVVAAPFSGRAAVSGAAPGAPQATLVLRRFLQGGLERYHLDRNDPLKNGQSGLSPYLHFGQISAQRIALEVNRWEGPQEAREAFLEELIVRRELSDNYCLYNSHYDRFEGLPAWARKTLDDHRADPREYRYTVGQLETADTHDGLWNAAQRDMMKTGRMHGYLRMYWAKKILEWAAGPEEALASAIELNDRYEMDGRETNGYAGIAWSIGGLHDRPWFERPVYGKIRYMSYSGCRRKFDVPAYVSKVAQ